MGGVLTVWREHIDEVLEKLRTPQPPHLRMAAHPHRGHSAQHVELAADCDRVLKGGDAFVERTVVQSWLQLSLQETGTYEDIFTLHLEAFVAAIPDQQAQENVRKRVAAKIEQTWSRKGKFDRKDVTMRHWTSAGHLLSSWDEYRNEQWRRAEVEKSCHTLL
ncbi:hypothetical protein ACM66B_004386 [Microbotryomycetes sp. NB124-2]